MRPTHAVHNDFHSTHGIFDLLEGLRVKNMDEPSAVTKPVINGGEYPTTDGATRMNGIHQVDATGPASEILTSDAIINNFA